VLDGHAVKRLPPAIEKCDTDESVTDEVAGLADEMMYLIPVCRADRTKEPHPYRVQPVAGVFRRHGGRGFESDHQNTQRRRNPIQCPVQDRLHPGESERTHAFDYRG
jgi:hypothetical protein